MILTKSEFKDKFGFKSLSSVSNLLKEKSIVATKDGLIDLNNRKNKQWISRREKELEENEQQTIQKEIDPEQLQFGILNERFNEKLKKNKLLDLKLAEANKEVIGVDVLNRVITMVFDSLFKELVELPNISAEELINIVQIEKSPKEKIITFLTDKILVSLKTALNTAESSAKKYYE